MMLKSTMKQQIKYYKNREKDLEDRIEKLKIEVSSLEGQVSDMEDVIEAKNPFLHLACKFVGGGAVAFGVAMFFWWLLTW